jgi:hypothetical protein
VQAVPPAAQPRRGRQTAARLTVAILLEAKGLYDHEQLAFLAIAERLLDRTPYSTAAALAHALGRQFRERDWKTRQTTRRRQTDRDERGPRLPEREPKATAS